MQIERFDPLADEQQLRACHEMTVAGQPEDDPAVPAMSFSWFRGWWALGFADFPRQTWLATDDCGAPIGGYVVELPELENRANAFGFVIVPPSQRRKGIGTALLAHMAIQSAQAGRSLLMSGTRVGSPASAFAAAAGATAGMLDVRRKLDVDAGLPARLAELRASAGQHAAGYSLRSWLGPSPEELVDGMCVLNAAMGDAPHDANFEPLTWDPARLRRSEERIVAQGSNWYSVAALAADGDVAAITQTSVEPSLPDWGWQQITAVSKPHRGHRLGLLVKVAMMELLAKHEPGLRHIVTFNAQQNDHMINVNKQLGYQVVDYHRSWELDVASASKLA